MSYSKLFGCNIHGSIRVSPIALKIIDTPEFQRLRYIKQLGLCYLVYPAATHTRFEHSLGVYHLAGKVIDRIKLEYPHRKFNLIEFGKEVELDPLITECIKIAGLCHDIGHGPFSHVFDEIVEHSNSPNKEHEIRSCLLIDILCQRHLKDILTTEHINFIKSLINPEPKHKGAIYQIIANSLNGIDVDKFDYLLRDSKNLGIGNSFDPNRLINELIIDKDCNIAFPKHCSTDIYELFHTRYMMHKKVYQHKTVKIIEVMLKDIFKLIDPHLKITESINSMDKFCKLQDDTIFSYLNFMETMSPDTDLTAIHNASEIYKNILSRKLYKIVYDTVGLIDEKQHSIIYNGLSLLYGELDHSNYEIIITNIGFINHKKTDLFNKIYFYDKKELTSSFILDKTYFSGLLNDNISETRTKIILKK